MSRIEECRSTLWITMILSLAFASTAVAQDKRINRSELPPAVQKTVDSLSNGATVRGFASETENGQLEYEVEMLVDGHTKDVSMDPQGNVLEVEEQVMFDKLSPNVRAGLQKKAGAGKVTKVESITKHGKLVAYEARILTSGKKSEVQVGPDGTALSHEE